MSNRFGLPDSLLDAVKAVTEEDKEVRQYRAFGLTTESKNAPSKENGGIAHDCASHVHHATYGEGFCIPEQHTIVETASGEGYVTHYDVEFDDCIVENVPVEELDIITESNHGHARKKKMEAMDPVGKEDDDVDNDGDTDASDSYLKNRRKAIKKSMGKESIKINPEIKEARGGADEPDKHIVMQLRKAQDVDGDHQISFRGGKKAKVAKKHIDKILKVHDHPSIKPDHKRKIRVAISKSPQHLATFADRLGEEVEQVQETKVDSKLENPHNCATHVYSEQWGDGKCITTMHAEPDQDGNIAWYDVFFEHGIEKGVPIEELKVVKSESHMHSKRGKK